MELAESMHTTDVESRNHWCKSLRSVLTYKFPTITFFCFYNLKHTYECNIVSTVDQVIGQLCTGPSKVIMLIKLIAELT